MPQLCLTKVKDECHDFRDCVALKQIHLAVGLFSLYPTNLTPGVTTVVTYTILIWHNIA